ncbi:hypothetical protein AB0F03_36870 [Streptomyces sp. NPDC028722]|uniref:hypothetical protein n=1 Tax=unclassified Streptomyces TaxID=2593676 RepID=UPI0033FF6C18
MVQRVAGAGLRVRVYGNLLRIRAEHWRLFEHSSVLLATTYASSVAAEHDAVTGRDGSHEATRANIDEAVRRGIRLKVAALDSGDHERAVRARAETGTKGESPSRLDTSPASQASRGARRASPGLWPEAGQTELPDWKEHQHNTSHGGV